MKTRSSWTPDIAVALSLMASQVGGHLLAQGLIQVATFRPLGLGGMDSPPRPLAVPVLDRDGRTYLMGSDYSAQLYAGPAGTPVDNLLPVGTPLSFASGDGFLLFGFQGPVVVAVPGVPSGRQAQVQLRAWDNAGGSVTNWESATIRGASASFLSRPLARSTSSGIDVPALDGIQSFQLEPSQPATGPFDGVFITAFANSHYRSQFYTPSSTQQPWLSGDGRRLVTKFFPDSGKSDLPALVSSQRESRAKAWQVQSNLPVVLTHANHYRNLAGISSDGSVIAINDQDETPESFLLVNGARVPLGIRQITALSRDGRKAFGLTPSGDLVRHDWTVGATVVLKAGYGVVPSFMQVSHDGSVAVVERVVWRENEGVMPVELPASFSAGGLSGDGRTLVGSLQNKPARLSIHRLPFTATVFGEASQASGHLIAASHDASVMCGAVTTRRGRMVVFTGDGRGYKLNELLPGTGAGLESCAATQISDDGRTLFGTSASSVGDGSDGGWIADLVLPGDVPRLQGVWTFTGLAGVSFPTRAGYRYQLENRPTLVPADTWSPYGPAIEGNGKDQGMEFLTTEGSRFFRLTVTPVPR